MVCWSVCVSENQDSSIRTSPSSGEKHLDSTSSDLRAGSERERASEQERERECMYACVSLCMCVCTGLSVCGVCVHARMSVSLSVYDSTRPPLPHPITGRRQTTNSHRDRWCMGLTQLDYLLSHPGRSEHYRAWNPSKRNIFQVFKPPPHTHTHPRQSGFFTRPLLLFPILLYAS